jgi:hypothetical protein
MLSIHLSLGLGHLATTAWRVLGLRMEGTASSWRLAANILNKQPRTNDKEWSSRLGVGVGLTTTHRKKQIHYEKDQ